MSIRDSAIAVMRVLLGEAPPPLPPMTANKDATETVYQAARVQSKYWKNIKAPPFEPEIGNVVQSTEIGTSLMLPAADPEAKHLPSESVLKQRTLLTPLGLLKEHRAWDLYQAYKLHQLPFADQDLRDAFDGLVLCRSVSV